MEWLRAYISVPFKVLAVFVRIFMFNRAWIEKRLARRPAANTIKGILAVTLLMWFLVWLFAGDDLRNNFTDTLESFWADFGN